MEIDNAFFPSVRNQWRGKSWQGWLVAVDSIDFRQVGVYDNAGNLAFNIRHGNFRAAAADMADYSFTTEEVAAGNGFHS